LQHGVDNNDGALHGKDEQFSDSNSSRLLRFQDAIIGDVSRSCGKAIVFGARLRRSVNLALIMVRYKAFYLLEARTMVLLMGFSISLDGFVDLCVAV